MLDCWLASQVKQAEFAPGISDRQARHPIPKVEQPETWQFGLHEHTSERAGHHFDLRLGHEPTGHAHSWAMRYWPDPGEARLAVQQPTHSVPYMDFQGELTSGYGKGRVRLARRDRTEVVSSDANHIRFNLYTGVGSEEYLLHRTDGDKWLLHNTTVTRDGKAAGLPNAKPKYKQKDPNHLDAEDPTTIWQAKIDGSHCIFSFGKSGTQARVFSYRPTERTTGIIEHTHRLPDFSDHRVPRSLHDTVVRGELYAADQNGLALEPARVGGLLNSSVWKSRQKQEVEGALRSVCFDVVRWRGRDVEHLPYAEKLVMLEQVVDQAPWLRLPRMAATPQAKRQLFEDIRQGKEPTTREGLVEWKLSTAAPPSKAKFLNERDVVVRDVFPESGKVRAGTMAGGFSFSYTKDGPVIGRVGTGMSHALKRDMLAQPDQYKGLTARILMQRTADRYAPRAPKFYGFHPDQELPAGIKTAQQKDQQINYQAMRDELLKIAKTRWQKELSGLSSSDTSRLGPTAQLVSNVKDPAQLGERMLFWRNKVRA
jgi:hypothetical protein